MSADQNLAVHVRWSDDNDRHDLSNYREYMHDDIEVHHLDGKTVVGIDAMVSNMAASIEAMPERRVHVEDRFATDDRVVCRWRVTGTAVDGATGGGAGSAIEVEGISMWEFDGGKARRGWVCSNAAFLMHKGVGDAYAIAREAYESDERAARSQS